MSDFTYRSICVPLDGTPFAEQGLPLALEIARRSGAILQLAMVHHVVPPLANALEVPEIEAQIDQDTRAREQLYLTELTERLKRTANLPVVCTLLDGAVAEALQAHIESSGTDLVVVTTHGRGPMSRFWVGSVADSLMRSLHLPVLVVHWVPEAAPPTTLQRILLALDGSSFSERAIAATTQLGRVFTAEYVLLLVVTPPMPIVDPSGLMTVPTSTEGGKELRAAGERFLAEVASRLRKEGLTVTTTLIEGPAPATTIIAQADALNVDLIALASHGAGGFKRLVLGSIADEVIRGSSHPTFVVRPAKGAD